MANAMMMDRTGMGMPGVSVPGMSTPGMPTLTPTTSNWMMVPRCTLKFEKCQGGMKITCVCDDKVACGMMQNLCTMLAGGMCSCYAVLNGMTVCCYNLTMGMCKCDLTDTGVCITCTTGDTKCCEMIQACCDSLTCMTNAGCTCCVLMNNNPVCCGYSESYATATVKTATKR
jgi:hypothetical protein